MGLDEVEVLLAGGNYGAGRAVVVPECSHRLRFLRQQVRRDQAFPDDVGNAQDPRGVDRREAQHRGAVREQNQIGPRGGEDARRPELVVRKAARIGLGIAVEPMVLDPSDLEPRLQRGVLGPLRAKRTVARILQGLQQHGVDDAHAAEAVAVGVEQHGTRHGFTRWL